VSLHNACLDKDKGQTPNIQYSSDYHIGIITDTTSNISSTCIVLALALTVIIVTAASLSATLFSLIVTNSLRDAFQCIAQPNPTLLDCILYPMQYPYDPGTLPSSANQCILGKVYLRSNVSRIRDKRPNWYRERNFQKKVFPQMLFLQINGDMWLHSKLTKSP